MQIFISEFHYIGIASLVLFMPLVLIYLNAEVENIDILSSAGRLMMLLSIIPATLLIVFVTLLTKKSLKEEKHSILDILKIGLIKSPKTFITIFLRTFLINIGYALLVLPGIFFQFLFSFSHIFTIIENKFAFLALKDSYRSTKNHSSNLIMNYLVAGGISFVALIILAITFTAVILLIGTPTEEIGATGVYLVPFYYIINSYFYVLQTVLYFEYKNE